jgi:hypothetical protein
MTKGLVKAFHFKENSMIVMGGTFQREMQHWTLPDDTMARDPRPAPKACHRKRSVPAYSTSVEPSADASLDVAST